MSVSIWEGNKAQELLDLLTAQNHLLSHQNAAIDLLASDKRSELASNLEEIAELVYADELLEMMDYGDKITLLWNKGGTEYSAPMNLCHIETAELEDGESIRVADVEWEYLIPDGIPFSPAQAIYESDTDLAAGTYYFTVANDSWGGNNGKNIQFTLATTLPAGYQIRKSVGYNALVTSGTLDIYSSGAVATGSANKLYSVTPTEGNTGTFLGTSNGTGDINHWHRVALGHNRWSTSFARKYLNATGEKATWWTKTEKWEVKASVADTLDGFLYGYDENFLDYFQITKIQTAVNTIEGGGTDITYDRVFLASLEQMYCVPQVSGIEGDYWGYYKRLLGRTTPAPTNATYARFKKYGIENKSSAQYYWRRSAYRSNATSEWIVSTSGTVYDGGAGYSYRLAPCLRIGR